MSKKIENVSAKSLDTLPEYLGLGLLDSKSIVKGQNKVSADYRWENEILYKVSASISDCQIVEFSDGKPIATTSEPDSLQKTFFKHLVSQPPYQSRQFERLFHRLADERNINVRFARQPKFLYYPAGYIFGLRQPIIEDNKSIFFKIEKELTSSSKDDIKLEHKREGIILKLLKDGNVTVEQVMMVDFSTVLFHLVNSVDMLWESGIVPKEKEHQLTVLDSSETPAGNISIYLGDMSRDFLTYSIIVTEGANINLEQVQTTFRDSSFQLLENLKK